MISLCFESALPFGLVLLAFFLMLLLTLSLLTAVRLGNLFRALFGVQVCLMEWKNSCDIVTIPQLSKVDTVKADYLLGK